MGVNIQEQGEDRSVFHGQHYTSGGTKTESMVSWSCPCSIYPHEEVEELFESCNLQLSLSFASVFISIFWTTYVSVLMFLDRPKAYRESILYSPSREVEITSLWIQSTRSFVFCH